MGLAYQLEPGYVDLSFPIELEAVAGVLVERVTKRPFGKLHSRTRDIITTLKNDLDLQIFIDRPIEPQISPVTDRKRRGSGMRCMNCPPGLFASLYGSSGLLDRVGWFASRCQLFLQHPKYCDRTVPYRNPHCLSSEGADVLTSEMDKLMDFSTTSEIDTAYNPIDAFADSIEHSDLLEAPQPIAIRTPLYKHQKQALDFMLRREYGWALRSSHRDVWKYEINEYGNRCFLNTVTGQKCSRRPEEFRGGLLTDAPGLGKTLCILALIAHSRQNIDSEKDRRGSPVTLLVVPKSRGFALS